MTIFHGMNKIKVDSVKINSSSYVPVPELKFTTTFNQEHLTPVNQLHEFD